MLSTLSIWSIVSKVMTSAWHHLDIVSTSSRVSKVTRSQRKTSQSVKVKQDVCRDALDALHALDALKTRLSLLLDIISACLDIISTSYQHCPYIVESVEGVESNASIKTSFYWQRVDSVESRHRESSSRAIVWTHRHRFAIDIISTSSRHHFDWQPTSTIINTTT